MEEVAKKRGITMAHRSLGSWLRMVCFHCHFLIYFLQVFLVIAAPIVGTTSTDKLQALIGSSYYISVRSRISHVSLFTDAVDIKLSEEEVRYIDEPYQPQPIFLYS